MNDFVGNILQIKF